MSDTGMERDKNMISDGGTSPVDEEIVGLPEEQEPPKVPSVSVEDLSTDHGDTPLVERPKNEMLSQALFSNKVRNMVTAYKEEILDLERKVREAVEENFRYLDMPEPGKVTRIVEKHISNMQAEILGIEDDLLHFELSKLNYGNEYYRYRILTRPTACCGWYIKDSRIYNEQNHWCADWNERINQADGNGYANNICNGTGRGNYAAVTHKAWWKAFDITLIDTKNNGILFKTQAMQVDSYHAFHGSSLRIPNWKTWLKETGTGSIGKYGNFYKSRSDTSEYYGEGDHHGWGLPSAGFYKLDNRGHYVGGANTDRFHQGAYDWHSSPDQSGGDEYLVAYRCNADGALTNEANSTIDFMRGHPLRGPHPVRIGDFVSSFGATQGINWPTVNGGRGDWNQRYNGTAGSGAITIAELINAPGMNNKGNRLNTLIYYWTWRDECPTIQDAENVESFLKFMTLCTIRWYSIRTHNWDRVDGTNGCHPSHEANLDHAANGTRLWMPKGCRHKEQMFHMVYTSKERANQPRIAWIQYEGPGGVSYLWEPRYMGITAAEAAADKAWREQAMARGEPLWDMKESAYVDRRNGLQYYIKHCRFVIDQERFHNAQALAQRDGASETDKKNYGIIKRWFYTKYDHLRSNKSQDQVEALGEKFMKLLEMTGE